MNLTITGNKVTINNNEYELPDEVTSFMVKKFLKMDDLIEENEILKDKVQDLQADYGTQAQIERDMLKQENKKYKTQQKEFIEYLEDAIKFEKTNLEYLCEKYNIPKENNGAYKFAYSYINKMEEILSKYKSIIGNNSDVTR